MQQQKEHDPLLEELEGKRTGYIKDVRRYTLYHFGLVVAAAIATFLGAVLPFALLPEEPPTYAWRSVLAVLAALPGALAVLATTLNTRTWYLAAKKARRKIDNLIVDYKRSEHKKSPNAVGKELKNIQSTYDRDLKPPA